MKKRTFPRLLFLLLLMLTALLLCIGAAAEPQPEPETTIISGESGAQPVLLASQISPSGTDYGFASFQFRQSGVNAIHLHSGEYINVCVGGTTTKPFTIMAFSISRASWICTAPTSMWI